MRKPAKPINQRKIVKMMFNPLRIAAIALWVLFTFSANVAAYDILELDIKTQKQTETVRIKLLDGQGFAPNHVARIKQLTEEGAYNNMAIHRAIAGFMIQMGDVKFGKRDSYDAARVGSGGSHYPDLNLEPSAQSFEEGVVGMARGRYVNSANSQFFIMTGHHPSLDNDYSVIGVVIEGLDFVKTVKMGNPRVNGGKVENPDYVVEARIVTAEN